MLFCHVSGLGIQLLLNKYPKNRQVQCSFPTNIAMNVQENDTKVGDCMLHVCKTKKGRQYVPNVESTLLLRMAFRMRVLHVLYY